MNTEICIKCHQEKPITEFFKDKRNKNGLRGECKYCNKLYKLNNKEKINLYMSKYNPQYYIENKRLTFLKTI